MRRLRFPRAAALGALSLVLGSAALGGCKASGDDKDLSGGLTGSPITIGYMNTEGKGALSFPSYTVGVHLAVERFNRDGGLDGHPLVLEECFTDGTPDSSIACANDLVQKQVSTVFVGLDAGFDAATPILSGAGIPAFAAQLSPGAGADPAFFQLAAPTSAFFDVPLQVFAQQGIANFAFVTLDVPQSKQGYDQLVKPAAKKLGLESRLVTYDPATSDYTSVVSTLKANGSEGVVFAGNEAQCSAFARSATSLGYDGVVVTPSCNGFIDELGSKVAGYQTLGFVYPPKARDGAPEAKQADLDQYLKDVQDADKSDAVDNFSLYGYGSMTDLAEVLSGIDGEVTPASAAGALGALKDFDSFAGDTVTCADRPASQGASCGNGVLVLEVTEDGDLRVVGDGFIEASES